MTLSLRGIGSYPNEPCYDPNRASWLPYWIPNGNETACNAAVAADAASCLLFPWTATCASGASKVGGAVLQVAGSAISDIGTAANPAPGSGAAPTPKCVGFQSYDATSGQCVFDPSSFSFIVLAVGIVGILFLVKK
jgi:hypothetical protein